MPGDSNCFVPGCKSRYKCDKKVSLFKPPSDPVLLAKWNCSIQRNDGVLSSNSRVCELHFRPSDIERSFKIKVGNVVNEIERLQPKLSSTAVPSVFSIFPRSETINDKLMSVEIKHKRRAPIIQCYIEPVPKKRSKLSVKESDSGVSISAEILLEVDTTQEITFNWISEHGSSVCSGDWIHYFNEDYACFGQLQIIDGQVCLKSSVSISKIMKVEIFYNGQKAILPSVSNTTVDTREKLIEILDRVQKSNACHGISDDRLKNVMIKSRVGVLDNSNIWRHRHCHQISIKSGLCEPCKKFKKILRSTLIRVQKKKNNVQPNVMRRSINRLKKKIKSFRMFSSHLKKKLSKSMKNANLDDLVKDLPGNQQMAIRHMFRQLKAKKTGMRYDDQWILSSILLRIKSPKAYEHLRDHGFLSLPCKSTLSKYIDVIRNETGISDEVLTHLKNKITTESDRHGVLLFDEIKLREGVQFNKKNMTYEGLVDFSEFGSNKNQFQNADTGLVFMYRPIMKNWMQAVGVFLSKGPTPPGTLSKILMKVILALESHGLLVQGLVSDGATTNRAIWKEYGISGKMGNVINSVPHPACSDDETRRLFFFSDYVHLFKCIRNNLLNKGMFEFEDGAVEHVHFIDLLKLDSCHSGLRAAPKLTIAHVQPNNMQRMNVRLAVQLFSNSVADALSFYRDQGIDSLEFCDETIRFVRRMNRLFDVLNAKLPYEGLRLDSDKMKFLHECSEWLDEWEKIATRHVNIGKAQFLSSSTSTGLRVTLKSTMELSKLLIKSSSFNYVLTSRFSQDPLELFFGLIRNASGCDDHPSATMFMQLYRLLSVYSLLRLTKRSVAPDSAVSLPLRKAATMKQTKHRQSIVSTTETLAWLSTDHDDDDDEVDFDPGDIPRPVIDLAKENIVFYIAGYVLHHFKKRICQDCMSKLSVPFNHDYALTAPQSNLSENKMRGKLIWPSKVFYEGLSELDKVVSANLEKEFSPSIFNNILEDSVSLFMPVKRVLCQQHANWLSAEIIVYYICTRLHWHAKKINQDVASKSQTKNHRKKAKLC